MVQAFSSQSTDSFRELLIRGQCSLLISTYQAGQLVVVRPQETGLNTHFMAVSRPMGIARRSNEFSLGGQSTITVFRNLPAVGPKTGQGAQIDACYLPRRVHHTGAIDIHEMDYDRDGLLWFVNTRMSCLATLSELHSFEPRWKPPFITAYDLTDRCHLNGLGFRNGQPRYVSMLGASDEPGGWRQNKISGGQIMDIDTDDVLVDGLCMPHSPRWYRDRLYFLSSGAGQLMSMTPGQAPEVVCQLPGFARGMDFIDRYALIGLSQIRESATFAGLPLTKRVEKRESGVWVVDLITGEIVAFLLFTGNVQEVFEVKVLPHRAATVIDEHSPLLANSYELSDEVLGNLAPVDPVQTAMEHATRAHMKGEFDQAIEAYRSILLEQGPQRLASHQLGLCLVDAGRWIEAIDQLTQVIEDQPDNAEAMNSLGLAWAERGESDKAMAWYDRSIATDQQFALGHFNRGLMLLRQGRYAEAWPEYDWRWQTPQFVPFQCQQPRWAGEDISDKRLLVHSEQGNGDHVMYLRFLPLVAERCRELIYVGPENMAPLVAQIDGVCESRIPGQIPQDRFDVWCPLMSLTRWLGITLENLPAPERYLEVPPQVVVSQLEGRVKVGLAWAGSATFKSDRTRSMPLATLLPLMAIEGVDLFALQMPLTEAERTLLGEHKVTNLEPELPGYARTAALVDQLDLVISVDTAIAHVAGALGKPVWILLSANPDWRWLVDREDSPWYPTARLYRQRHDESDFEAAVARVRQDLEALSRS